MAASSDRLSAKSSGMSLGSKMSSEANNASISSAFRFQDRPERGYLQRKLFDFATVRHLIHEERGVVSVKVDRVRVFRHDDFLQNSDFLFVQINNRDSRKTTWPAQNIQGRADFNGQTVHLPVLVPQIRNHPFNQVELKVFGFQEMTTHLPDDVNDLGSLSLHLHDIIRARCIKMTLDLWDTYSVVGQIDIELTFNYGLFGYGVSSLLTDALISPQEALALSLFPRLETSDNDEAYDVPMIPPVDEESDKFHAEYASMKSRVGRILSLRQRISKQDNDHSSVLPTVPDTKCIDPASYILDVNSRVSKREGMALKVSNVAVSPTAESRRNVIFAADGIRRMIPRRLSSSNRVSPAIESNTPTQGSPRIPHAIMPIADQIHNSPQLTLRRGSMQVSAGTPSRSPNSVVGRTETISDEEHLRRVAKQLSLAEKRRI